MVNNAAAFTHCYAANTVGAAAGDEAGFLVSQPSGSLTITNCYYDDTIGHGDGSAFATAKTTAEMKVRSTFASWDFRSIWTTSSNDNSGYPYHGFEPSGSRLTCGRLEGQLLRRNRRL